MKTATKTTTVSTATVSTSSSASTTSAITTTSSSTTSTSTPITISTTTATATTAPAPTAGCAKSKLNENATTYTLDSTNIIIPRLARILCSEYLYVEFYFDKYLFTYNVICYDKYFFIPVITDDNSCLTYPDYYDAQYGLVNSATLNVPGSEYIYRIDSIVGYYILRFISIAQSKIMNSILLL